MLKEALLEHLEKLENVPPDTLLRRREERFLALGDYGEV
jgi:acetyl-CoA carboxylase alpha subunit